MHRRSSSLRSASQRSPISVSVGAVYLPVLPNSGDCFADEKCVHNISAADYWLVQSAKHQDDQSLLLD
ncbi:hypothetical protein M5689_005513 [Euphorbia peplus]|nr:hypothetical protein M5689_005513 [Euphorbia peplus]